MASSQSTSTLPQGFSVYQPTLGAQLQFFPALGTQQLDDLINAFIPGPAAANEKRATISLDFLEYAQMTGQTFKFYPAQLSSSAAGSPITASPSLDSVSSSFNVSPVTSSWDWSATSAAPSVASSSRNSTKARRHSKATTSSPSSRHQTTDFSSLPGMKILTKDGLDVTNSASRGSKTKEQRDHAHLMRIIKACDSCKRKKIRCDPSHKKRGAAPVAQAQPQSTPKPVKKARTAISTAAPAAIEQELLQSASSFDLDTSFSFSALESLDTAMLPYDPFEEFMQFPPVDETPDFDFDLFVDTEDYVSSQSASSTSSSLASPQKSFTPSSQDQTLAPPGAEHLNPDLQERNAQFPFLDGNGLSSDYTDFNLYSPQSSFSEDERMLPIGSSTGSLRSLSESQDTGGDEAFTGGDGIQPWSIPGVPGGVGSNDLQFLTTGDNVGGNEQGARLQSGGESVAQYFSSLHPITDSDRVGQVVICCPPGGTVVLTGNPTTTNSSMNNVPTSFSAPADPVSLDILAAESPGVLVDQSGANVTAGVSHWLGSESSAAYVEPFGAPTSTSGSESPAQLAGESVADAMSDSAIRRSIDSPSTVADQNHLVSIDTAASPGRDSSLLSASTERDTTQRGASRQSSLLGNTGSQPLTPATRQGLFVAHGDGQRQPTVAGISTPESLASQVIASAVSMSDNSVSYGVMQGGSNRPERNGVSDHSRPESELDTRSVGLGVNATTALSSAVSHHEAYEVSRATAVESSASQSSQETRSSEAIAELVVASAKNTVATAAAVSAAAGNVASGSNDAQPLSTTQSESSAYSSMSSADTFAFMSSVISCVSYQLSTMYMCATVATAAMQYASTVINDDDAPLTNLNRGILV